MDFRYGQLMVVNSQSIAYTCENLLAIRKRRRMAMQRTERGGEVGGAESGLRQSEGWRGVGRRREREAETSS